ncbi:putative organic cation transporter protein-like isoform X1 [Diplonema papillatum]|nr:putative organic cation transporter protein-like isoform X1 [Diplonema papillatum]
MVNPLSGLDSDTRACGEKANVDELIEAIGCGRYQCIIYFWSCMTSVMWGMQTTTNVFTGLDYDLRCVSEVCTGQDAPSMSRFCADPEAYAGVWERYSHTFSVVMEWGSCGDTWMGPLIGSVFFAGWFCGGLIGGSSDILGRARTSALWTVLSAAMLFASTFSPNIGVYYALRFVHGVCIGAGSLVTFVFGVEACTIKWQGKVGSTSVAAFGVGTSLCVLIAYHFPHWKDLSQIIAAVGVVPVFLQMFLYESPRWLVAVDRCETAEAHLRHIARINDVAYPSTALVSTARPVVVSAEGEGVSETNMKLRLLFQIPITRQRVLIMGFFWFVCSLAYYGLNFAAGSLGGDLYLNVLLLALVELPACALQAWMADRPFAGRRGTTFAGFLTSSVGCILFFVLSAFDISAPARIFALFGKMGIFASFVVAYVWTAELFPTNIRGTALGWCTSCARIGGLVAPFAATFEALALLLFGTLAFIAAVLCRMLLPETVGKSLPECLADLEGAEDTNISTKEALSEADKLMDISKMCKPYAESGSC